VTPFVSNPSHLRTIVPRTGQQQPQSGLPATLSAHDPFPSPQLSGQYSGSSPIIPVGLSDKELARMRAETLQAQLAAAPAELDGSGSQLPPVPVGLSAKELARMRAETLQPHPAVASSPVSDESVSRPQSPAPPSPVVATEPSATPSSPHILRTLQLQFERMRREIQQLRAERSGSEAPPSYAEREASHHSGGPGMQS
jgi:hypothetical protein